jgi:phosphotransferase system HPr (HPr) family protein
MTLASDVSETKVEVKNVEGLHMRPAMEFVKTASQFRSRITVANGDNRVDGKSIMQVSSLVATCGTELVLRAEGEDAEQAILALQTLVDNRFET